MTRIIIEIDGKDVSSTTAEPTGGVGVPSQELLARAAALGATNAGSAPSDSEFPISGAIVGSADATDAGAAREQAAASESPEDTRPKTKPK